MKKAFKIIGILLVVIIVLLIAAPFLFKGSIEKMVQRTINKNLNATVAWKSLDLSLFKSFPDAALTINDFSVINNSPFEGDTLVSGKTLKLDMGIRQLFKNSSETIKVDALFLDKAFVNIKVDTLGNTNYDISLQKDTSISANSEIETDEKGFAFDLNRYEIKDSHINYLNAVSKTFLVLKDVNHQGTGDLSATVTNLVTKTETLASLKIEDVDYLNQTPLTLDAIFELDFENQKYTFLENEAKVNDLPLTFNGFVKINENNNELDLSFKTPSSDFKNFLAVIPKTYVKELDRVTTTGNFSIDGSLKGIIDENHIPKIDIEVKSDNASFKYPNLPKAVSNISIDVELKNETGLVPDTYLNVGGMTFKIDDEIFNLSGSIKNLTENALVNLALNGTLNLANIEQVLPIELNQDLTGVFTVDVITNFDMRSVENEQYQNIKSNGSAQLTGFTYNDEAFNNEINISNAAITMSAGNIRLDAFDATTGETDIKASGDIQNLIPWIMAKQDLKGRFKVDSNTFNVNDFMTSDESTAQGTGKSSEKNTEEKAVKIPGFLDATIDFTAKKVLYDNIVLDNAKGTVGIKNEVANLSNVTSKIFGGDIAFSGNVDTKNTIPTFGMNLDLNKIDIEESFGKLALLKYIAPLAKALDGNLTTTIKLEGLLNDDLTPNLSTLAGDAIAQILSAKVNTENTPLLGALNESLSFLDLDNLNLNDVHTALTFSDGKIVVKPFDFDVKGIKITAGGSHGLDKSIDYNLTMDVPAKYLGSDISKLLAKLDPSEAETMTVALPIGLKGNFTNPKVSLNTNAAVSELTKQLVAKQKEELLNKGTDILGDIISGGNKPKDSTTTSTGGNTTQETTTEIVKDILGGLFGKNKKKDTTKTGN